MSDHWERLEAKERAEDSRADDIAEAERRGELKGLEAVVQAVEVNGYGRAGAIDFVRARIAELKKGETAPATRKPCSRRELNRDGFGYQGMLPAHTCTKEDHE